MTDFRAELDRYLAFRRVRGFKLDATAAYLLAFINFLESRGADIITNPLCMAWNAEEPTSHGTKARRIISVRGFAAWLRAIDPRHEIPPPYRGLIGKNRPKPHIYTLDELGRLVGASRRLSSRNGIRRLVYSTLWPFLYVTGLRIGEALAVDHDSFDYSNATVLIPPQKGSYERLVPLHPTTVTALQGYIRRRDRLLGGRPDCFFVGELGQRLKEDTVQQTFARVAVTAGIRKSEGEGPRIHDLRHTFAVNTLLQWYRDGKAIEDHILTLVDVLGHASLRQTYWYIENVPELLHLASRRFERYLANGGEPE